ncbi:hypothetical protein I7I51_06920 [Histoplasma capsulatum]|uniref:Uncharacterized protein n=1 Tax=Ajellomyces capsulatus TaxID=5037 RepID=A0A8A1MJI9_AJECA|nr:hypothetical protein I7I51_06920 [Histoplasma capsulatum]
MGVDGCGECCSIGRRSIGQCDETMIPSTWSVNGRNGSADEPQCRGSRLVFHGCWKVILRPFSVVVWSAGKIQMAPLEYLQNFITTELTSWNLSTSDYDKERP